MCADHFIINELRILTASHKLCVHVTAIQWVKMRIISKLTCKDIPLCKEVHFITPSFHHSVSTRILGGKHIQCVKNKNPTASYPTPDVQKCEKRQRSVHARAQKKHASTGTTPVSVRPKTQTRSSVGLCRKICFLSLCLSLKTKHPLL